MGYDSITAIAAVKVDVEIGGRKEERTALFMQIADSNLTVERNGREVMSRSWNLVTPRDDWRVMQEVVKLSASCEGGMLRYKGRSDTRAETLIAACRKAIETAPKVRNLFDLGGQVSQTSIGMRVLKEKLGSYGEKQVQKLIDSGIAHKDRGDELLFEFPATAEGLAQMEDYAYLATMWCSGTSGSWDFDSDRFERWAEPLREKKAEPAKIERGDILVLKDGISFKFDEGKACKIKVIELTSKKNVFYGCGIVEGGIETKAKGYLRILPQDIAQLEKHGALLGHSAPGETDLSAASGLRP